MDWSAIFAGIATLVAVAALIYGIVQHRETVRREFLLWAIEQISAPDQRFARKLIFDLNMEENKQRHDELIAGIREGKRELLQSEELGRIRSAFALFDTIGYFLGRLGYGNMRDAKSLFPQAVRIWEIGLPYIQAYRERPNQEDSFRNFELFAAKLKRAKRK